ncbi:aminopeptidase N [Sphingomonas sp. SORGH_AS 950]|uniref:M1 family aminopeptidase n=1 Tax=Sphingomonas sp. SORGH_AS_0950 TaxID=3041792 RepID=UPI0027844322|nr:M1 family aminopeptidase [Sphingomonas sp. SORGH_AS_0950]MDQ1159511.1 aminopeptidase N [Sphingomonas sp. SORGH_AS_0950]
MKTLRIVGLGILLALQPISTQAATPDESFDVIGYDLALTPDIANKTLAGHEILTLRATMDGLTELRFSPNALTIDYVTLNGVALPVRSERDALTFTLPEPLRRGRTVKLDVTYHGQPARGFATSANALYTSYFACDWMICRQNAFGDKGRFALRLRVPLGMTTVSVGTQTSRRPGPDGSEIHSWRAPRPYSPYLFGFAVGRFIQAGSTQLPFFSDVADAANLNARFADTPAMVDFYADKAGYRLPVRRYAQLLVKGNEAQEAATYAVLGDRAVPDRPNDPDDDWAIAHELAHQWWGNLLTCGTIQEFWLNEGIATFMSAAWKEHRYGRAAYDAEMEHARAALARARDAGYDKPLAWNGTYPKLGLRRAIQYSKGTLFMDALRSTLGDKAFWAGLRLYTRAHAGGVVTSHDLQRAMERASGRDLDPLFAKWVYG